MAMLAGKTHPGGSPTAASEYLLGLDIGTTSIGWALIALKSDEPCGILRAGVRCFEAGVEGDIEAGKDSSRARPRRIARLARRARQCIRAAIPDKPPATANAGLRHANGFHKNRRCTASELEGHAASWS
jgi:hypothetical protein